MKNEKGITLASLVITIIVLMILASIVTYSGVGTIRYTNYNKAKAEIEMMQANVNTWYDEYKKIEVTEEEIPEGETAEDVLESKQQLFIAQYGVPTSHNSCDQTKLNNTIQGVQENGYTVDSENLMFLSAQALKNIFGIDFTYDYLVNIPKRQVILFNGVVYNGKTYYTAEEFGIMNVSNYELDTVNFDIVQGDYDEIFIYNLRFVDTQSKELNISKFRVLISEHGTNSWKDVTNNITETTYNEGKAYYLKDLGYKYYDIKVATLDNKTNQIDIELIEPRAIFKTGVEINAKMKQLAGIEGATYETEDTNIKEIKRATKEQFEENADNAEIVSTSEQDGSNTPIYMWFDNDNNNGIIYYYSKALKPELNGDSSYLFYFCTKATNIDISSVDTSNTTNMRGMFGNCYNLTSLNVSNFNTSKLQNAKALFASCKKLASLDVSNFDTSNIQDMSYMFYQCNLVEALDVSHFNTKKVRDMECMFRECSKITELDLSSFDTSNVENLICFLYGCESLETIDVSNFNTAKVTSMRHMFHDCKLLQSIDISGLNTANVEDMEAMFIGCEALTEVKLNGINTSNVTNMSSLFSGCLSIKNIDLSGFNTSKVQTIGGMFYCCSSLEELDLSNFNTSNVEDMSYMFGFCNSLEGLNISSFNTSKVTNMKEMFNGCLVLTSLNTSSFDTSNVTDMERMFCDCREITSLDVSSFHTSKVTKMYRMFSNCYKLITIYASNNFVTTNFQNYIAQEEGEVVLDPTDMFYSSYRLVGGAGTSYNLNKINKAYARIDGGTSNSGYFTTKPSP